jgi:eukaryotic-like serine/threonine-protein kinase
MNEHSLRCSDFDLLALLANDHRTDDDSLAIAHLGECAACQHRLASLAAGDDWWRDCQTHLPSAELESDRSTLSMHGSAPVGDDATPRDDFTRLLGSASHPELLGRIGRYQVERMIGRGGMGIVFKAHDAELNRPVAIKVLAPHLACNGSARQRFGREARATASVVHEHVVGIYDVEAGANPPYLVMQYVHGESLQSYVEQHGPLESSDLIRIAHQISSGLAAAHEQGLIHRDIKPGNVMLENGLGRVMVTDFGLARAADDLSLTHSGLVAGTPHFMSPEQARGEAVDARCDLFSLGAVMYFMATGHPPFRAEQAMAVLHRICHDQHRPLPRVNPQFPRELARVVDRLLEKKPSRRFAAAGDVQDVLVGLLSNTRRPRRWIQRIDGWGRVLVVTLATAAVTFLVVATSHRPHFIRRDSSEAKQPRVQESEENEVSDPFLVVGAGNGADLEVSDYSDESIAIRHALARLEHEPYPETGVPGLDPWAVDIESLSGAMRTLEASWLLSTKLPLFHDSSNGEPK